MNNKIKRTVEFLSLGFITLAAYASGVDSGCTPVVYVFRHAEDYTPNPAINLNGDGFTCPDKDKNGNCGPYGQLTQTGATHASIYPSMITNFQANHKALTDEDFCPVQVVYAANPSKGSVTNTMNLKGADNAFCTARPLARSVNEKHSELFPSNTFNEDETLKDKLLKRMCNDLDDNFVVKHSPLQPNDPIVFVKVGSNLVGLDEYLGTTVVSKQSNTINYKTDVAEALRANLVSTAKTGGSSAIFWTSQGLHVLGSVIINANSVVPQKTFDDGTKITGATYYGTPPRNAVYIFKAKDDKSGFNDTPDVAREDDQGDKAANWVQCFNHVEEGYNKLGNTSPNFFPAKFPIGGDPAGQRYYCGYGTQSDLGAKPSKDYCGNGSSSGTNCTTIPDGTCEAINSASDKGCNQQVKIEICNVNVDKDSKSEYTKTHIDGTGQAEAEYGSCIPAGWL
jgi:hypothetical protein